MEESISLKIGGKKMKKFSIILCFCFLLPLTAQETSSENEGILFQFNHQKGSSTSHVAEVVEAAYLNGILHNKTQFVNRMTTTIKEVVEDGSAQLETNYMTTQNTLLTGATETLSWGEESTVNIYRKPNGQLYKSLLNQNTELPTIRGVPSFPNRKVKPGENWSMKGLEVHDCMELFQMDKLLEIPFTADYTYVGPVEINEKIYHQINVYYEFQQTNYNNSLYKKGTFAGIQGRAAQEILWDKEIGDIFNYKEEFEIEMFDIFNNSYYFTGISGGNVTEYKSLNTDEDVEKIKNTVEEYDLKDVTVSKSEKGLTISVENIQFEPDSDILLKSEKEKLHKLGEILKTVSNDLLITGHCADRGTRGAQQNLSESRASAVANFLVEEGVRDSYHIFTQGKGAREPIASNKTEAGRAKNRRVEITIMD